MYDLSREVSAVLRDSNNECRGVSRGRGSRPRAGQGEGLNNFVSNKGAAGIDGMKDEELRGYMNENWPGIKQSILERSYKPAPVRRVEIPKPTGRTQAWHPHGS